MAVAPTSLFYVKISYVSNITENNLRWKILMTLLYIVYPSTIWFFKMGVGEAGKFWEVRILLVLHICGSENLFSTTSRKDDLFIPFNYSKNLDWSRRVIHFLENVGQKLFPKLASTPLPPTPQIKWSTPYYQASTFYWNVSIKILIKSISTSYL